MMMFSHRGYLRGISIVSKEHNVFVSHAWGYSDDADSLRRLINDRAYFHCIYSDVGKYEPINSNDADYIKRRLREKIQCAHVMIGMAGVYASHSEWMQWEMDTAIKYGIPLIGVIPWGAERVSTAVSSRAIEMVRWNTESIITALRKHSLA